MPGAMPNRKPARTFVPGVFAAWFLATAAIEHGELEALFRPFVHLAASGAVAYDSGP